MLQPLLVGVFPLAGVLIGAALQYAFGRSLEARKQLAAQRAQAYIDFFRAASAVAQGSTREQLASATDAKARICIYGSAPVVRCLAKFQRAGANLSSADSRTALLVLLQAMRSDVVVREARLDDADLADILFGREA